MMTAAPKMQASVRPVADNPIMAVDDLSYVVGGAKGELLILKDVSLAVRKHEFVSIVGASGCGKTTLLRLLAGLLRPTSGQVTFNGAPVTEPHQQLAVVFQDYGRALLPWRTVADNVSLALEARRVPRPERPAIIAGLLQKVGLGDRVRRVSAATVRRHAAAPADRPLPGPATGRAVDGRAVRRARRHDPAEPAGRGGAACRRRAALP